MKAVLSKPFPKWIKLCMFTLNMAIVSALAGLISILFGRKEVLIRETALSVALVLSLQKQSGVYAYDRIRDTFIGVVVALIVQFLVHRSNKSDLPESE